MLVPVSWSFYSRYAFCGETRISMSKQGRRARVDLAHATVDLAHLIRINYCYPKCQREESEHVPYGLIVNLFYAYHTIVRRPPRMF